MAVSPPPPLPSLIADAFVSLSLLALSVGRPETTNARALILVLLDNTCPHQN